MSNLSSIAQEDIARMMAEIGSSVKMHYGAVGSDGSGAWVVDAAKLICSNNYRYAYSTKHCNIMPALKSSNGVVLLSGYHTKIYHGTRWLGTRRAIYKNGHAMLVDGYITYKNGVTFLHVNYGWGSQQANGYFLDYDSKDWTIGAKEAKRNYPYKMKFYSIAKKEILK
jgi:hypothetical protein